MEKTKRASKAPIVNEENLPQNIQLVGERDVESKKTVYILQSVYKEIHRFAEDKITVENGGMLIGRTVEQFGKTGIIINGFVEAKYCEATANTLKFTHETWAHCHKEIAKKFAGQKIVGWIHTHPGFGIFFSEYDEFIQSNFFKDENQVAFVVDPVQDREGFYYWRNGKITLCSGFFIFDKTGTKMTPVAEHEKHYETVKGMKGGLIQGIATGVLFIALLFLIWQISDLTSKIDKLQTQQQAIIDSANQNFVNMQQQITVLQAELNALKYADTAQSQETDPEATDPSNSEQPWDAEQAGGETPPKNAEPDAAASVEGDEIDAN